MVAAMRPEDLGFLVVLDALLQEVSVSGAARRFAMSTPAMSHALARIRVRLGDPLLVRAGRRMVLTPRAEALRPKVRAAIEAAEQVLAAERPFVPAELARTFAVLVTDYVLTVLGLAVDELLRAEAPEARLRFVPNTPDDPAVLRAGEADLAIGIYGDMLPELRSRLLLTDRHVAVLRRGHPAGKRLTLDRYVALKHVQIAPRGRPGGYIDDVLREHGRVRVVARAVPFFVTALQLAARTDYVLTVSERIARRFAPELGLEVHAVPLPLRPYALSLVWHPRFDGDPGHRFLREAFTRTAEAVAGDRHDRPRTRLTPPGKRRR
jgi:DNA-binding transcriptional LysR family regulator